MDEPGFGVLRMIQAAADVAAARRANDHRHRRAAAVPIPEGRRLIDDLIEAADDEVGELHLGDGPIATQRRADADADDGRFGDRRVDHAHLAELVVEALGDAERAAVGADILAQHEDLRIAPHLLDQRLANGLQVREFFAHERLSHETRIHEGSSATKTRNPNHLANSTRSGNHEQSHT